MRRPRSSSALGIAILALGVVFVQPGQQPRAATPPGPYVLTDLGTLGGLSAQANDLNNLAQVVGYATNAASQARAFRWQAGSMTALPALPGGTTAVANAINGVGDVAGYVTMLPVYRATLWDTTGPINLTPNLTSSDFSTANGINDAREVVGTINSSRPFVWRNHVLTILGHLGGGGGAAFDINNAGQIVGSSYTTHVTALGLMQHAVLWEGETITDLGLFPGDEESGASAINSLGQIVGTSGRTDPETYESTTQAFLYSEGAMTPLPVPSTESYAGDINDAGIVVGTMRAWGGPSRWHAWIYADGVATNLNSLIPAGSGLHLAYGSAINNAGQIAGVAVDAQARYHAYLLTPAAPGTPVIQVSDASVTEGHTGTRTATFTVSMSPASSAPVSVTYGTNNVSATAGTDYEPATGTLTLSAGQTSATVAVTVLGDTAGEPNETFQMNLSEPSGGALIGDAQGVGTIIDDEPRLSVNDVSKNEGQAGTTPFTFTVVLSSASSGPVTVGVATSDGSAKVGGDYDASSISLTFAAGQTSRTATVNVKGDRTRESDETFSVRLSGAIGALVADGEGTGVIRNDDR
jgi:probable HAF family extracellular repeat protein